VPEVLKLYTMSKIPRRLETNFFFYTALINYFLVLGVGCVRLDEKIQYFVSSCLGLDEKTIQWFY